MGWGRSENLKIKSSGASVSHSSALFQRCCSCTHKWICFLTNQMSTVLFYVNFWFWFRLLETTNLKRWTRCQVKAKTPSHTNLNVMNTFYCAQVYKALCHFFVWGPPFKPWVQKSKCPKRSKPVLQLSTAWDAILLLRASIWIVYFPPDRTNLPNEYRTPSPASFQLQIMESPWCETDPLFILSCVKIQKQETKYFPCVCVFVSLHRCSTHI